MNGSREDAAFGAEETPERPEHPISLATARRMLPLVRQIVADLMQAQQRLARLQTEQEILDENRRTLTWPQRSRRYQLREDVAAAEAVLEQARVELEGLGVAVVNAGAGGVGFPTLVNNRKAYFSWLPGEEDIRHWHFAGDDVRRLIPAGWFRVEDVRLIGQS